MTGEDYDDELEPEDVEEHITNATHAWAKDGYTYPLPNPIERSLEADKETVIQALSYLYTYEDEDFEISDTVKSILEDRITMLETGLSYIEKASVATYVKESYTNLVNLARKELGQPPL